MVTHWLTLDLLMLVSSVVLYLTIQKATEHGLSLELKSLTMFASPFVAFTTMTLVSGKPLLVGSTPTLILVGTGLVVFINNYVSLKSLEQAPNPGYSLAIAKSYVVLTTLLAVVLFGARLTSWAALAVVMIVVSVAIVMVDPSQSRHRLGNSWAALALAAMVLTAGFTLVAKYLATQGIPTLTILSYLFGVGTLCTAIQLQIRRFKWSQLRGAGGYFVGIGLANTAFNLFNYTALVAAPNVGYVNATNAASTGVITLAAAWLLGDELNRRKLAGVAGIITGLCVLLTSA